MEDTKKESFFQKIRTAIFKLENYGTFLEEKVSKSFKYLLLLLLLSTIITAIAYTVNYTKTFLKVRNYIENDLPEFVIEEGILKFDEYVEGYDAEYDSTIVINTFDVSENDMQEYINKVSKSTYGVLMLKDKATLYINGESYMEQTYKDLFSELDETISNKEDVLKILHNARYSFLATTFLVILLMSYIINVIQTIADVCIIAIVGWFFAKICGINLKVIASLKLTIYSITLSIILSTIYSAVNITTGAFTIEYFNLIYLIIAYIYLIAALFIIRDDLMRMKPNEQEISSPEIIDNENKEEPNTEEKPEEPEKEPEEETAKDKTDTDSEENDSAIENENRDPDGSEI